MFAAVLPLLVLASTILATPSGRENTRQYTIYNRCPTPIDLYIAGAKHESIPTDGSVTKTLGTGAGPFYTTANGGSGNGDGTIRAGFHEDYYYIVSDPKHANTGLRVKPKDRSQPYGNSFCQEIECDGRGCLQAFTRPPTSFPAPSPTVVPVPPYYRCPIANTDYEIMFCPTGQFADQGQPIHYNYLRTKCLNVRGGFIVDGTPVQLYDCIGTQAQRWIINRGDTKVQVAGTNFCLDAGPDPANGVQPEIWTCNANNPVQQWVYTANNRIMLKNRGFCIDLEQGDIATGSKVQTWTCTNDNDHQVWNV